MKPLDLDEIGRTHRNAMLNTATGRTLALTCSEIQQLRAENDAIYAERQQLRGILHVTLADPSGTVPAEFDLQPPLVDAAKMIVAERERLRAENAELAGALRDLFDATAGTPVSIVTNQRGQAMIRAKLALKAAEAAGGTWAQENDANNRK